MRLKLPPKEALNVLNQILQRGLPLYRPLNNYSSDSSLVSFSVLDDNLNELENWYQSAQNKLKEVFQDYALVYKFSRHVEELLLKVYQVKSHILTDSVIEIVDFGLLLKALDVISDYAISISERLETPLYYIPSSAQIWYYTFCVELEIGSNEEILCKYLFENTSFNEFVGLETVFINAFSGDGEKFDQRAGSVITNAANGINIKTKEVFNFPIVKRNKSLLALTIPANLLSVKN